MKAWSRREKDDPFLASLHARMTEYSRDLAQGEVEKRRSIGAFLYEKGEAAHAGHVLEMSLSGYETNPLFHNLGGKFVNLTYPLGTGLTDDGRGVVAMDLDRDGDQDLVVHNAFRPQLTALRNDLGTGRTVVVSLRGVKSNRFGVGARVVAIVGGRPQAQEMHCGSGYLSGQPLELVFGLGGAPSARLEVVWPGGAADAVDAVKPGRVTIEEGKGAVAHAPHAKPAPGPLPPGERVLREGDRFELAADGLDGRPFDWPKGKPLVVHFWSGYCRSCQAEVPQYRTIIAELKRVDPAIELVSVNVDGELEKLQALGAGPGTFGRAVARAHARGILPSNDPVVPLTVVVGADGVVRARRVGAQEPVDFASLARRALK